MFDLKPGERLVELHWQIPDRRDPSSGVWYFAATEAVQVGDEGDALRRAANTWFELRWDKSYGANWGDAIDEIDDEQWAIWGLRRLRNPVEGPARVYVNHDEVLS